jgi:hypothetical protein
MIGLIESIYVIGDARKEPERIAYLEKYFKSRGLDVTYFQPTYMDNLSTYELSRFTEETHGRLFKAAEKSIFLNFLYLFEKCVTQHGYVLILESDVIFEGDIVEYLNGLEVFLTEVSPECVSIGSGCDLIDDSIVIEDMNFQIVKKNIVRCMDSLVFSNKGLTMILDYMKNYGIFDEPIDNFLEKFIKGSEFSYYWVWPSITLQGSQYGYYKSSIQNTEDSTQPQESYK